MHIRLRLRPNKYGMFLPEHGVPCHWQLFADYKHSGNVVQGKLLADCPRVIDLPCCSSRRIRSLRDGWHDFLRQNRLLHLLNDRWHERWKYRRTCFPPAGKQRFRSQWNYPNHSRSSRTLLERLIPNSQRRDDQALVYFKPSGLSRDKHCNLTQHAVRLHDINRAVSH